MSRGESLRQLRALMNAPYVLHQVSFGCEGSVTVGAAVGTCRGESLRQLRALMNAPYVLH